MKPTQGELLDIVYRFYPRGVRNFARIHVPPNEPFYDDTEEHRRLVELPTAGEQSKRLDPPAQHVRPGAEGKVLSLLVRDSEVQPWRDPDKG